LKALELMLVRHGESTGNVARERAEDNGAEVIEMPMRDADVPLSPLGESQARALGRWLARDDGVSAPGALWCSPYLRARMTAELILQPALTNLVIGVDERLRDRELGVLDLLTSHGVRARFPEESRRRQWLGKFYYRPPGGESWADVALRLRSFLADLDRSGAEGRHLIVSHDAVILLFRYICEGLDETTLFSLARQGSITNASLTTLLRQDSGSRWRIGLFNDHQHLDLSGVPVSEHPGQVDVSH
jgi:broad specificity phosphatase PhoE